MKANSKLRDNSVRKLATASALPVRAQPEEKIVSAWEKMYWFGGHEKMEIIFVHNVKNMLTVPHKYPYRGRTFFW